MDYSQYMKKIWVVKGWDYWEICGYDNPSFRIDRMENGRLEGRFEIEGLADNKTQNFEGTIYDGVAECVFFDDGNEGMISMKFESEEEIRAEIEYGGKYETYFFRPYNLADISEFIVDEEQSFWKDLNSWGEVYFAVGIMDTRHSYPLVQLVNEKHDILYQFWTNWLSGTEIYNVSIEDINGDGLKDVRICICFSNQPDLPYIEKIFLQEEDGFFEEYINSGINIASNECYELRYNVDELYGEKEIRINCSLISVLQNGALYQIDTQEEMPINCFPIYLYVQDDRIYRLRMTSEEIEKIHSEDEMIENGILIFQESDLADSLNENTTEFWEEFHFSEGKRLTEYRCGYGTEEDVLELRIAE